MRIGCCTNMIATGKDGIGAENIGLLSAAGFDYIELPLNGISALTESEFAGLEETVRKSSIRCEGCNSFFPSSLRIIGPGSDIKRTEEYVRLVLSRAARLGSKQAGIGSGPSRSIPDGYDREKGYNELISVFRMMGEIAGEYGMMLAIEPLRSAETNMITTFAEAAEASSDTGMDNVKALVDLYHMAAENDAPESIVKYRDYLVHAHIAYPALGTPYERTFPGKDDDWNYVPFFRALKEAGYDDKLSVEAYCHSKLAEEASGALDVLTRLIVN